MTIKKRFIWNFALHFKHRPPFCKYFSDQPKPDAVSNISPSSNDDEYVQFQADNGSVEDWPPWLLVDADFAKKSFDLKPEDLEKIPFKTKPALSNDPFDKENVRKMWYKRDLWVYALDKGKRIDQSVMAKDTQHPFAYTTPKPRNFLIHRPLSTHPGGEAVRAALINNGIQTCAKFGVAFVTCSSAILSEAIHSLADFVNQLIQRWGLLHSAKRPSRTFPFGHGHTRFTCGLFGGQVMIALGGFAAWTGFHQLGSPHVIENIEIAAALCGLAVCLETYSTTIAYWSIRKDQKKFGLSFKQYLQHGPDSASVHVFSEDCAGLFTTLIAFGSVMGSTYYPILDPMGSIAIGTIVTTVGGLLTYRNFQLLLGKSIPIPLEQIVMDVLDKIPVVHQYHNLRTVILGAETCLVKVDLYLNADKIVDSRVDTNQLLQEQRVARSRWNHAEWHDRGWHDHVAKTFADFHHVLVSEKDQIEFQIARKLPFRKTYVYIDLY